MKKFIVTAIMMVTFSAAAQDTTAAMNNFKSAMKCKVGDTKKAQDVRLNVSKIDQGVCGSGGSSLVATLEVVKNTRSFDPKTGEVSLVTSFVPVKTWAVPLKMAEQLTTAELVGEIMADDQCLE